MSRLIKKHRRQFAGVAFPLFFLFILGAIGLSVFPGWVRPSYSTLGAVCTTFASDTSDPLLGACDVCLGEVCSFASAANTGTCTQGLNSFDFPSCPSCQCTNTFVSNSGTFFPDFTCGAPSNSFCQGIAGGNVTNDCRVGTCTSLTSFNPDNPSGCDFIFDTATPGDDCVNCAPPTDQSINCGNGVCEEASGETFDSCPEDCEVPGFPFATPLAEGDLILDNACFDLPPPIVFGGNVIDSDSCEDGNICTTNTCVDGDCDVEPAGCSDVADFCCPSGCNPPPSGPGTCNVQLDPNCDDDCLEADDCEPTPIPTPSPIPPVNPPVEIFGAGLLSCSIQAGVNPGLSLGSLLLIATTSLTLLGLRRRAR